MPGTVDSFANVDGKLRPTVGVLLGLAYPQPDGLRLGSQLLGDRAHRFTLRPELVLMIQNHSHRTLA